MFYSGFFILKFVGFYDWLKETKEKINESETAACPRRNLHIRPVHSKKRSKRKMAA